MKKIILIVLAVFLLTGIFCAWKFFGPATAFNNEKYFLYIKTGMTYEEEIKLLQDDDVLQSISFLNGWRKKWITRKM